MIKTMDLGFILCSHSGTGLVVIRVCSRQPRHRHPPAEQVLHHGGLDALSVPDDLSQEQRCAVLGALQS